MGLDVTALRQARKESGNNESAYAAYGIKDLPDRMDGMEPGRYLGEHQFGFRAGSYGGYNEWRKWLSFKFLRADPQDVWDHPEKYEGKPFFELVNFSDCEGAFGPKTSAKLAKDFQEHASDLNGSDEWDVAKYHDWQKAFELAADSGLVILH